MSRFDLFFVVLDTCEEAFDSRMASHIVKLHQGVESTELDNVITFSREQLQRYIRFARAFNPVISPAAQKVMVECYRNLRQNDTVGASKKAYRVTVRQLESLIRLSEALARLHLDDTVRPSYVKEAYRLLRKSIIHVESADIDFSEMGEAAMDIEEDQRALERLEDEMENAESEDENGGVASVNVDEEDGEVDLTEKSENSKPSFTTSSEHSKRSKKKKKTKIKVGKCTYDKYKRISNMMALHLQEIESKTGKGLKQKELVAWCLRQQVEEIETEAQLKQEQRLLHCIIEKLVVNERIFLVVPDDEIENSDDEENKPSKPSKKKVKKSQKRAERTLVVHPNFVLT
eukprot:g3679.t1